MSESPVVSLEDVKVEFATNRSFLGLFGEDESVSAVNDVSLDIGERDIVTLIGESGCGKSTLGRTVIGAQRPTAGSVRCRGQDVWDARDGNGDVSIDFDEIRHSLQIIHQDPSSALNPNQRILTSLMLPLKKWNPDLSRPEREARVHALVERVGLSPADDYVNRFPHQLSGGEKQRVVLCRALLMNPDVILADEAISALDVSLRVEMMDLMLDLQEEFDTSYVFISHDLSNARYFTQHGDGKIGVMYLGELAEIGPAEDMVNDPHHPYTNVLRWATPDLSLREAGEPPMRKIDIPDPVNPPSGCRFHTRCPAAREACRQESPPDYQHNGQRVACFREDDEHEYWDSPELTD